MTDPRILPADCPVARGVSSTPVAIRRFAAIVDAAGHGSPTCNPRGSGTLAARGQLCSTSQRWRRIAAPVG